MAKKQEVSRSPLSGDRTLSVRRGAKALIHSSDRCLLVEERHSDGSPFWTLPGGGVHGYESLANGLRRELAEELCCQCLVEDPLTRFWYVHSSLNATATRYTVFECSLLSEPTSDSSEGVVNHRWVDPSDPPPSTLPQVRHVLGNGTGPSVVSDDG